jgi:hypothetical protein
MDWDVDAWPLSSLVEVVASTDSSWTLRFVDWPKTVNNGRVDSSKLRGIRSLHQVDPVTGTFGVANGTEFYSSGQASAPKLTFLDDNTIRFDFDAAAGRIPVASPDRRYLLRHIGYDAHGFVVNRCTNCSFDDITVHAVPGKLVVGGDGSKGLAFTNIRVEVPALNPSTPGNAVFPRHVSAASDGIFLSGTSGDVLIQNVTMSNLGDDCINVHDVLAVDTSTPADPFPPLPVPYPAAPSGAQPWSVDLADRRTLVVRSNFFAGFQPRDPVHFVSPSTLATVHKDTLEAVTSDLCGTWRLTFANPIPAVYNTTTGRWLPFSPFLQNTRFLASKILIDRLWCSANRARGVLVHTDDTILSNSRLTTIAMACMFVRADLLEREGRGLNRAGVYGNILEACDRNGWSAGAIDSHVWGMWDAGFEPGERIGMRDSEIVGNVL